MSERQHKRDEERPPYHQVGLPEGGACYNCGFLCQRDSGGMYDTPRFSELPTFRRDAGRWHNTSQPRLQNVCYLGFDVEWEVIGEIEDETGSWIPNPTEPYSVENIDLHNRASNVVFTRNRECQGWVLYKPGRDPEQHLRWREMIQLERERRRWEETQENERRQFEERLDESNKEFLAGLEGQRREWENESGKWPSRLIWAAIILAAAEVAGTFLGLPAVTRLLGLD